MPIIYILQRDDRPELCKVGKTIRSAASRGKDYTDGLWRPAKEFSAPHYLLLSIEEKAHQLLKEGGHWLNPEVTDGVAREIFLCNLETAEKAILSAIKIVAQEASQDANNLMDEYQNSEGNTPEKKIEDYEPTVTTGYADIKSMSRRYSSDKASPQIVTNKTWAGECDGCHEEYSVTINRYDTVAKCPYCFYTKPIKEQ